MQKLIWIPKVVREAHAQNLNKSRANTRMTCSVQIVVIDKILGHTFPHDLVLGQLIHQNN